MKKFLSLVLALVMTMSLVTISAGAEFEDSNDIKYDEAVDVLTALDVVGGYGDDTFRPAAELTRGAAAKIICNMLLGPTTAEALPTNSAPFTDVPAGSTFAGYIAYCAKEGIIGGYSDGTFRPSGKLTGYAFMKMLLGALGYDAEVEGYTGSNWAVSVAKRALNLGLDDGLEGKFNGSKYVNREEACLYAFNTLQTAMVEYENSSTITVGDIVIKNNSVAQTVKDKNGDEVLFMDEYFDDLTEDDPVEDQEEAFGRPAHSWYTHETKRADKYLIGTYADSADYVLVLDDDYSDETDAEEVFQDLADNDDLTLTGKTKLYVNGEDTKVEKPEDIVDIATYGTTVELFCDSEDKIEVIVAYYYTLAKIDDVDTDVSSKDEKDGVSAYVDIDGYGEFNDTDIVGYDADTYEKDAYIALIEKDDEIIASYIPETVEGVVSSQKAGVYVKMDGQKYTFTHTADDTDCNFKDEYTLYLDENGYALGIVGEDAGVAIEDVFYVTDTYEDKDTKNGSTWYAEVVSLEGVVEDIVINSKDADKVEAGLYVVEWDDDEEWNDLTKYEDAKDTDYDMVSAANSADIKSTASKITVGKTKVYVDDATQYISITTKTNDSDKTTWVKKVNVAEGGMALKYDKDNSVTVIALYDSSKDAAYVLYVGAEISATVDTSDVIFVEGEASESSADGYETSVWFMEDLTDDVVTTDKKYAKGFWTYSVDEDGVYSLKDATLTSETVDEDTEGGTTLALTSYHDDVLSGSSDANKVTAEDVDFSEAEIIDLRSADDTDADKYDREITSVSTLKKAMDAGSVSANVYFVDGVVTFIAVYKCEDAPKA